MVLVQVQGVVGCQVLISMSSHFLHSRRMLRGSCSIVKKDDGFHVISSFSLLNSHQTSSSKLMFRDKDLSVFWWWRELFVVISVLLLGIFMFVIV